MPVDSDCAGYVEEIPMSMPPERPSSEEHVSAYSPETLRAKVIRLGLAQEGELDDCSDESVEELILDNYLAARVQMDVSKSREAELRILVSSLVPEVSGTRTLKTSKYVLKVTRSLAAKYSKDAEGVSVAQTLYAHYAEVRTAFRVTLEERVAEMEKVLVALEKPEASDEAHTIASTVRASRTMSLSPPQVKVEKASD